MNLLRVALFLTSVFLLLIYLPALSPRCNFIFDLVFKDELGIQYATTTDVIEFQNFSGPKLNYSDFSFSDECFIKSHGLLFENEIKKHEIEIQKKEGIPLLFYTNDNLLDFDIFSAVFYLVSRYEEYLPFIADEYGRYKAENSLAFKNNFLQIPVVNIWINMLKDILQKKYLALQMKLCQFNAIVTYDIDVAFKYSGRNFGRSCGAVFKNFFSFNLKDVYERLAVLLKWKKDPWDVYDDLSEIISKNKLPSIFFFFIER